MAVDSEVFVDSNYFIAFYNPSDSLHKPAVETERKLQAEASSTRFVISPFVFSEVVTVLSQRVGKGTATRVGRFLLSEEGPRIVQHDEKTQGISWGIFEKATNKNISFVDCSIIATMQTEGVSQLITFDKTDFRSLQKHYRFSFYSLAAET